MTQEPQTPPAAPRGLVRGFGFALRGVPFVLSRPALLSLAAIPVIINLLLFFGLVVLGLQFIDQLFTQVFPFDKPESGFLAALWWVGYYLVRVLLYLLGAVVTFLVVVALGSVIAAPFNDAISERTEIALRGTGEQKPFSLTGALGEVLGALRDQLALLSIYFLGLLLLLLLHLVPVLGSILSSLLSFLWTCWFFALEFTDPPLARAGKRWRERWSLLSGNLRLAFGFGVGAWIMLFVPLTMPFLFCSATLMTCALADAAVADAAVADAERDAPAPEA